MQITTKASNEFHHLCLFCQKKLEFTIISNKQAKLQYRLLKIPVVTTGKRELPVKSYVSPKIYLK